MGKVRLISYDVFRCDLLESGSKIFYHDATMSNLLKRLHHI